MSEFTCEAFEHTTEQQKRRLCIRFSIKPDGSIIAILKSPAVNGRYRKCAHGARPCWYVPFEHVAVLHGELSTTTQLPGGQVEALCRAVAPFATTHPSSDDEPEIESELGSPNSGPADQVVDSQEGPPLPPRKRLRLTEARRLAPCRACAYEVEAIARGYGFGQYYHTCEEGVD